MAINDNSTHPLERNGTAQRERLLKALIPGQLLLDSRNMADLLAFVGTYAKQIRYWDENDQPDGDWTCFWKSDATPLLAIVAATDLNECRVRYRNAELAFIRECKAEKRAEEKTTCEKASGKYLPYLVTEIFGLAVKIQEICESLPAPHPLKTEVCALIREKLAYNGILNSGTPLEKLIQYHKTANEATIPKPADELIERYQGFFGDSPCRKAWGLTPDDFNCIDFHPDLDAQDRDALWQLFLRFFKILSIIVAKAQKVFQQALNGRSDHPPHIALFLAFALLFRRYHQSDMNAMTDRHLTFYYRDILRLQEREAIPDGVHIVFELARNAKAHRLQKDTLLLGGKDSKGLDLLYALTDELVVNKATLVEKQSLYFFKTKDGVIPIALLAADKKDGLAIPYEKGRKAWHPLSGKNLFAKLAVKERLLSRLVKGESARKMLDENIRTSERIVANPGLIISTPELWLAKGGERRIIITIAGCDDPDILSHFYTEISTTDGLMKLENEPVPHFDFDITETTSKYHSEAGQPIVWQISIPDSEAGIAPLPEDAGPQPGRQPFVRLCLRDLEDYNKVSAASFAGIHLKTSNNGLRNLALQLGATQYLPSSEIPLIGSTTDQEYSLYASVPEISLKTFRDEKHLSLNGPGDVSDNEAGAHRREVVKFGKIEFLQKKTLDTPEEAGDLFYSPVSRFSFLKVPVTIPAYNNERKPVTIYKIPGESFSISYRSEGVDLRARDSKIHRLYHHDFLGGYAPARRNVFVIGHPMPEPDPTIVTDGGRRIEAGRIDKKRSADGNLRLGFENLEPGQALSILFHFAEGTGNPDHIAPEEIVWSYLRDNEWIRIPAHFILSDETLGLKQTGIVRLQIPSDIHNGNTLSWGLDYRTDLYWLMASASEDPVLNIFVDALPMLADIYVQAATAVFQNNSGNDLVHLEKGLPEESITQLRFRDPAISLVQQPFKSFDGRYSEAGGQAARRIHERLRHKQRAVTVWDYERITLEKFNKIAISKCLPHTRDTDVRRPGHVTMGVIPYPENMVGDRIYYPTFNAGELETFERYVNRHNTFFVSGQGGGVVCCCADGDDGCGCHGDGTLLVRNAIFEPVRLHVCVRFRAGREIAYYKKLLNKDLKAFLAPWATDSERPILFGAMIETMELLRFLENLDYVDVIMDLKIKHFPGRRISEIAEATIDFEEVDIIEPFTSRSVLTTYLDMLNEDNPNVTDHDIQVVEDGACCAGCN
jgi:hypothetical protein